MKIAIIGAGFTGLAAAIKLAARGVDVSVFEQETKPGGLAIGFKDENWSWSLEKHYHHIFTNDTNIQEMARLVGANCFFDRPKTSTFVNKHILQIDSPISLLKFGDLSMGSRIKTGLELFYLKFLANWKDLESETAAEWLRKRDLESYKLLWEPLLRGKFGEHFDSISAAWFWARIKKRTMKLGYFEGGFENLAAKMESYAKGMGVKFKYSTSIDQVKKERSQLKLRVDTEKWMDFDKVIVTGSSWLLAKIAPDLPEEYKGNLYSFKGLGAVNLVLALNQKFFDDGTYWLNINEKGFPFLAVVEHTNFVDREHYGGDHLIYVGNYLDRNHAFFKYSEEDLISKFSPYLRLINKQFSKKMIRKSWVFKTPFAQPIVEKYYSKKILPFKTPIENLYWGSMQQVYPWDRGTNYAVETGERLADLVLD